ncbi:MAG TPA: STAS domain-containing protein [bacterium]|nr:STAS domain-containing protein [bacterium]
MDDNFDLNDNLEITDKFFEKEGTALLTVRGEINSVTVHGFEKKLLSVLGEGRLKVILDLRDATYISSAGWGILVSQIKRIRGLQGDLILTGMRVEVEEIFKLLDFHRLFKVFPDPQAALKSL